MAGERQWRELYDKIPLNRREKIEAGVLRDLLGFAVVVGPKRGYDGYWIQQIDGTIRQPATIEEIAMWKLLVSREVRRGH